jgi:hypothetical protein
MKNKKTKFQRVQTGRRRFNISITLMNYCGGYPWAGGMGVVSCNFFLFDSYCYILDFILILRCKNLEQGSLNLSIAHYTFFQFQLRATLFLIVVKKSSGVCRRLDFVAGVTSPDPRLNTVGKT